MLQKSCLELFSKFGFIVSFDHKLPQMELILSNLYLKEIMISSSTYSK